MALCNFIQPDKMRHVFSMYLSRMQGYVLVEKTFTEESVLRAWFVPNCSL